MIDSSCGNTLLLAVLRVSADHPEMRTIVRELLTLGSDPTLLNESNRAHSSNVIPLEREVRIPRLLISIRTMKCGAKSRD